MKKESLEGWWVKCISNTNIIGQCLTLNSMYKVEKHSSGTVFILDDTGKRSWYLDDRFEGVGKFELGTDEEKLATANNIIKKEIYG
jgi:hypothetical protein